MSPEAVASQNLDRSAMTYRLSDRYLGESGRVHLTGIQALARVPIDQLRLDRAQGFDTAALVSGYPGSPLGGLDLELPRAISLASDLRIVHQPAVNEELAATAVMGSQLAGVRPDARHDGVVGIWYGKAPGLDRATDALRHGVFAGSSRHGGALVLVGDDPLAKSSTMPSSSDAALVDLHTPILYPGTSAECLELGLHGIAMSRASGLWSALKIVTPVADGGGTVDLPVVDARPVLPTLEVNGEVWTSEPSAVFLGPRMVEVEREFREIRLELARRYGLENRLNRVTVDPADAWIGMVATGFTYHQLREALRRLGLGDEAAVRGAGIRLLHLKMPVPFDDASIREFARGLDEVIVVEEKNPTLEWLIKNALHPSPGHPVVVGKTHEDGRALMPVFGRLDADAMIAGLHERLSSRLGDRLAPLEVAVPAPLQRKRIPLRVNRTPFYCSGCPHNWGTKIPDGTLVGAGTGCHGMSLLMDPERVGETIGITAMGNEGAHWIGMSPFVKTHHLVQNLGDGTYFHSGQLAVQAAIGAGTNITFKILYNETVAMTGGQDPSFHIGVTELAQVLDAQGAARILITTDDPDDYDPGGLPSSVEVWDRTRIVEAQRLLAEIPGVTVLINHQPCAAELRRARRRGRIETPSTRVVINHRICEGCGDCGDKSNCLSVQPLPTPLGRKTQIDQATCNLDYSCLEGDCPAFMTVDAAPPDSTGWAAPPDGLPEPEAVDDRGDRFAIRIAGIGGTGVVTVAQVLSTAAMLDGWDVHGLDQTGLSQKAGPVVSDVVLTRPNAPSSNLIGTGEADTLLALDPLVGASDPVLAALGPQTQVIGSSSQVPTGAMITSPAMPHPTMAEVDDRLATDKPGRWMDALAMTAGLLGDATPANVFVLGAAVQASVIPVTVDRIETALTLNGVAVDTNLAAFAWGRQWFLDPTSVETAATTGKVTPDVTVPELPTALGARIDELGTTPATRDGIRLRTADLVAYQNDAYANRYLDVIARVAQAEQTVAADLVASVLTYTVARNLYRLMAYKDEYEVARLALTPEATRAAEAVGGPGARPTLMLDPPTLRSLRGSHKMRFKPWTHWTLRLLARGQWLRGTWLDPFGRSELRKTERALIDEYISTIGRLAAGLTEDNIEAANAIADLPDTIRGFEDLKLRRIADYRSHLSEALTTW